MCREPVIALVDRNDSERVDVNHCSRDVSGVSNVKLQSTDRQRRGERRDRQVDVVAAVEVGPMGAIQFTPAAAAVSAEPQVGFVEIAEQEELANRPGRRQPENVRHVRPCDFAGDGPSFVFPAEVDGLVAWAFDMCPAGGEAIGRERSQRSRHTDHDTSRSVAASGCLFLNSVRPFLKSVGLRAAQCRRTICAMTPLEDAQAFVLESCPPREPVALAREEAGGLVLAEAVVSTEIVPPFDNTAVDGYAVRSEDVATVPVELDVIYEIAAGAAPQADLGPGQAVRIMTGAPLPGGADAVVMVEYSERLGQVERDGVMVERVRLAASVGSGAAIRGAGDDVLIGEELFEPGTIITPAIEGVLASVNARQVTVYPRLRVAVLSTGDELITDGSPLAAGQIRESNKTMLAGMLAETGCEVVDLGVVRDDEAELERVLRSAAGDCDAIVSSGGVSMGDYDVVKAVLGRIADMTWMQMAIKPAKPFAFGKLNGVPVFGLPGNPVSSMVSFELMARPALRRMMGHHQLARPSIVAIADQDLSRNVDGKVHFMRVNGSFQDDGRYHVAPVGAQGSHQLAATANADAMAVVPDGSGVIAGGEVAVLLLR